MYILERESNERKHIEGGIYIDEIKLQSGLNYYKFDGYMSCNAWSYIYILLVYENQTFEIEMVTTCVNMCVG